MVLSSRSEDFVFDAADSCTGGAPYRAFHRRDSGAPKGRKNQSQGLLPRCSSFIKIPGRQGVRFEMARPGIVGQTPLYAKSSCPAIPDCFGIFQKVRRAEKAAAQDHASLGGSDGAASAKMAR